MYFKAHAGPLSAHFDTQTQAEQWAMRRARELGLIFKIERGEHGQVNGETGWWQDLTFEPVWIFEEEPLRVAPV